MYKSKVVSMIYYEHQKEEYVLPHSHNYYEMVFYKEGRGVVNTDGEAVKYEPNSVFVVKPGVSHDEFSDEFSVVYIVLFETEIDLDNIFVKFGDDRVALINRLFTVALEEFKLHKINYNEYIDNLFNIILIETIRLSHPTDSSKTYDVYINHIKQYIRENYVKKIDFNILVKNMGYSYNRFRHIFKDYTGTTLKQYLLDIRLDEAKNLLVETDILVKDVAQQCGFIDSAQFVKFFSKRMNLSPQKFRKMISEENDIGVINTKKEK